MLAILELLMVPLFIAVFIWLASEQNVREVVAVLAFIAPILVAALGSLTMVAALKMKRLESYGLAIAASILAIVASPSNLIGLAIGIWSLVVLSRGDVAKGFEQQRNNSAPARPWPRRHSSGKWVLRALALCLGAFLPASYVSTPSSAWHHWHLL